MSQPPRPFWRLWRTWIIGVPLALLIALIAMASTKGNGRKVDAQFALERAARDPASLKYRNEEYIEDLDAVCGQVSGANAFGGQTGYRLYWYQGEIAITGDAAFTMIDGIRQGHPERCRDAWNDNARGEIGRVLGM